MPPPPHPRKQKSAQKNRSIERTGSENWLLAILGGTVLDGGLFQVSLMRCARLRFFLFGLWLIVQPLALVHGQSEAATVTEAEASAVEALPLAQAELTGEEQARVRWRLQAARDALHAGFPGLAQGIFAEVLAVENLPTEMQQDAREGLISTHIARLQLGEARTLLQGVPVVERDAAWRLRMALVTYFSGQPGQARALLNGIRTAELPPEETAWRLVLEGLLLERENRPEAVESYFQRARNAATSEAQAAQFEALILRQRILAGDTDPSLEAELREKAKANAGKSIGLQFARELAILLEQTERKDEALELIAEHARQIPSGHAGELNEMRMLEALIAGPESARGKGALRQILRNPGGSDLQQSALYLLAGHADAEKDRAEFRAFLDTLLEQGEHPIEDDLLLLRGRLALEAGELKKAEESSQQLRQRYPGSPLSQEATRLLAYLARQREQYRIAAGYLGELRETLTEGAEKARLGRLMADAYFLNRDYANASELYGAALAEGHLAAGELLRMQVLADLRGGNIDAAGQHLDSTTEKLDIPAADRWQAEWLFLRALRSEGRTAEAFARLRQLLENSEPRKPAEALEWRLRWLQAQLAYEVGEYTGAMALAVDLLDRTRPPAEDPLAQPSAERESLRGMVRSRALLLLGQARMAAGEGDAAIEAFNTLRENYGETEAAAHSYLVEARYFAARNQTVRAQRLLQKLAEAFPGSEYAPIALFEAAENAEARGLAASLTEANEILKTLIEQYPEAPLVFYARLKQGDLARQLNDFGAAQSLYELLLQQHGNHPERYRVELALADTLLAQASRDPNLAPPALAALERLFDLPEIPLDGRAEAGFKWGFLLDSIGNASRAQEVYWLVISRCLLEQGRDEQLREQGRYWMSRCIFELGVLLEKANQGERAAEIYQLIGQQDLPGQQLAQARLNQISGSEETTP